MISGNSTVTWTKGLFVRGSLCLAYVFTSCLLQSATLARWSMTPTDGDNPVTLDVRTAPGEGVIAGFTPVPAPEDHLWTFNGLGNIFPTSSRVPPVTMFSNGFDGGSHSFIARDFTESDGALFFPQFHYGNEFSFTEGFTLELFFSTIGDQSGIGEMPLLFQGEETNRYSIFLNQNAPGGVQFNLGNGSGEPVSVDLAARNYADGNWFYLLAIYEPEAGANGELRLVIVDENGEADRARVRLDESFPGLSSGNDGDLFLGRNAFFLEDNPKTFAGFIDEVQISSGLVADEDRLGFVPPEYQGPIVRWNMEFFPGANPVVLDTRTAKDEGTKTGTSGLGPAEDHLWAVSDLDPSESLAGFEVPPLDMFANGNEGGFESFDASLLSSVNGALHFPPVEYGHELNFEGALTIELFFKTHGDQSGAGPMQLIYQGEDDFRYGLVLNESGAGVVSFALDDGSGTTAIVDTGDHNYADGGWYYLVAVYQPQAGGGGFLSLMLVDESGVLTEERADVPSVFQGLPIGEDGNLLLGRRQFALGAGARTFEGLLDEVQISTGLPASSQLLGVLPARPLEIVGFHRIDETTTIQWASAEGASYSVDYAEVIDSSPIVWTQIAVVPGHGLFTSFTDDDPVRGQQPTGYYRIRIP